MGAEGAIRSKVLRTEDPVDSAACTGPCPRALETTALRVDQARAANPASRLSTLSCWHSRTPSMRPTASLYHVMHNAADTLRASRATISFIGLLGGYESDTTTAKSLGLVQQ